MQDIQMGNVELESFFKPDFEARLSDIFVTESASCKVGVVCLQKAPKQPTADLQSPNQNSEKSFVTWVSTLAHLKTALEVTNISRWKGASRLANKALFSHKPRRSRE